MKIHLHTFKIREICGRNLMFALQLLINLTQIHDEFLLLCLLPQQPWKFFAQRADDISMYL